MSKIINLPYNLSHFIKQIHFLTIFLRPLTWNGPYEEFFLIPYLRQKLVIS